MDFIATCQNGDLDKAISMYESYRYPHNILFTSFINSCTGGHFELSKWLLGLGVDIRASSDAAFIISCMHDRFEIIKWIYELDPNILLENIRNIHHIDYGKLGISEESAMPFECIKHNNPFPEIEHIDKNVIYSLAYYNMIGHLVRLREQFNFILFDVVDGKVTNLSFKMFRSKNANKN